METIKIRQLGDPIDYNDRMMMFEVDGESITIHIQLLGKITDIPASKTSPREYTAECTGINILAAEYTDTGEEVEIEGNLDYYRDIYTFSYLYEI